MIIALDLETTWLDKKKDSIIEIALIKFDENTFEIIETFSSFVNPWIKIPDLNLNITWITDEMVADSPTIVELIDEIRDFIWDFPILWHNTYFDRDFLIEKWININDNTVIDTFFLANFLSLGCKSMSLESLAVYYNIELNWAHRAYNDTKCTINLFKELLIEFNKLSLDKKRLIGFLFSRSINKNIKYLYNILSLDYNYTTDDFFDTLLSNINYVKQEKFYEKNNNFLSIKEYISLLPNCEYRENQINMAEEINLNFCESKKTVIEAPTWIWKTLAYLIPSIIYSLKNKEKVYISTKTKILQDQLYYKDLKFLKDNLDLDFSFTKIKWKSNYISINSFVNYISNFNIDYDNLSFLSKMVLWLTKTNTWELDEVSYSNNEHKYLKYVNADNNITLSTKNIYLKQEFLYRHKNNLDNSNIIIVNHSLLFTDLKNDFNFFWEVKNLIIDEAHSVEDIATDSLKNGFNIKMLEENLDYLIFMLGTLQIDKTKILFEKEDLLSNTSLLLNYYYNFLKQNFKEETYYQALLISKSFYSSQEIDYYNLIDKIQENLRIIKDLLKDINFDFSKEIRILDLVSDIIIKFYEKDNDNEFIKIASINQNYWVKLEYTILNIWEYLNLNFWTTLKNCFLLSATITIFDSFEYINNSLKLWEFTCLRYQSDFDYSKQAILYIPTDIWNIKNNFSQVNIFLKELFTELKWNTLSLFTSLSTIRSIYVNLNFFLSSIWIKLMAQSIYGSKNKILETFMSNTNNSIILWTDSFWEWIDIPWNDLKYLIIHKMPFVVPTDPIFVARSKIYKDPFTEYSVPKSIMKLKQGFWRLIRTRYDNWIVFFLDDRIFSTSWWKVFLDAFPHNINLKMLKKDNIIEEIKLNNKKYIL